MLVENVVFKSSINSVEGITKNYTVAGKVVGFAIEQPLHVVALACSALGILKWLHTICQKQIISNSVDFRSTEIDQIRIKLIFRNSLDNVE
jgi:hypothetical protein